MAKPIRNNDHGATIAHMLMDITYIYKCIKFKASMTNTSVAIEINKKRNKYGFQLLSICDCDLKTP